MKLLRWLFFLSSGLAALFIIPLAGMVRVFSHGTSPTIDPEIDSDDISVDVDEWDSAKTLEHKVRP